MVEVDEAELQNMEQQYVDTIATLRLALEAVRAERDAALEVLAGLNAALDRYWNDPLRSQADHAEQHAREITLAQQRSSHILPKPAATQDAGGKDECTPDCEALAVADAEEDWRFS